ncbi:MAG: SH3 domain-containing protein [Ruminococcus sp.]|nr:SH3 domain-containing protein [Ruminococcus sp.]
MKKFCKNNFVFLAAFALAVVSTGCSMFEAESSIAETEPESKADRYIETTQTGRYAIDADGADEELNGFTTTREESASNLENPVPDEPDPDIIATTTTTWFTTTKETTKKSTSAKSSKTTKTTKETALVSNKLHAPTSSEKFKSKKKYKVTSDTTYLNLRFGPSKEYDVQLKIPDGKIIYGTAKTITSGDGWIYVTYEGTSGWVMEDLLKSE